MDLSALVAQAVELVANHAEAIASGVANRVQTDATSRLYELVRDRLQRTEHGSAVLGGLGQRPQDADQRSLVASALADAATADQEFAATLRQVVHEISISQGSATGSDIRGQANISVGGGFTMTRSNIAAGNIDNSRHSHFGGNGLILIAVLVAMLIVAGGTTAIVVGTDDSGRDPATMGTDPGEAGARESTKGILSAIGARDAARFCAFLSTDQLTEASRFGGCEQAVREQVFNKVSPDVTNRYIDAKINRVIIDDSVCLAAYQPPDPSGPVIAPDVETCDTELISEARSFVTLDGDSDEIEIPLRRELGRWVTADKEFPGSKMFPHNGK